MRNMRPTTSGGVHEHPKNWRKSVSSVSYDTPDWMKTYQTHIVNGPPNLHDMKMIAGKNNEILVPRSEIHKLGIDRIRTRKTKTPQVRLPAKAKPVKMIAGQTHTVNGPVHDVKTIASKKNDILVPYLEVEKVRKEQERTRKTTTLQVAPPASKGPAVQSNVQTTVVDQGAGSNTTYHEKMVLV